MVFILNSTRSWKMVGWESSSSSSSMSRIFGFKKPFSS